MATAAGLLSPGLVSLVKRAQKLREEMDEQPTKLVAMDANSLPRKNGRHFQSLYIYSCFLEFYGTSCRHLFGFRLKYS